MLTRSQIQREERQSKEHRRRINETFLQRDKSRAGFEAWERACREWHNSRILSFYLWTQEAHERMRRGEREVIEDTLLFLEVDPWFFRSGYLKERVLRHLKGAPLNDSDRARLRQVIRGWFRVATAGNCATTAAWRFRCGRRSGKSNFALQPRAQVVTRNHL